MFTSFFTDPKSFLCPPQTDTVTVFVTYDLGGNVVYGHYKHTLLSILKYIGFFPSKF